MKAMICGFEHKQGTFRRDGGQEVSYDNIILYCLYKRAGITGDAATAIKFKSFDWVNALKEAKMDEVEPIGLRIDLDYDNQGNFCGVGLPGSEIIFDIEMVE